MHTNPDLLRNDGEHCFASPLSLKPITENYDTLTKDVTSEFLMFFSGTYGLLNCISLSAFFGMFAVCCKSDCFLTILKLIQWFCSFLLLVLFVWVTIVRFKTRGKVCSGDMEDLIEN